jgi:hypothetical protein
MGGNFLQFLVPTFGGGPIGFLELQREPILLEGRLFADFEIVIRGICVRLFQAHVLHFQAEVLDLCIFDGSS